MFEICCWIVAFFCLLTAAVLSVHKDRAMGAPRRRTTATATSTAPARACRRRGGRARAAC